MLLITFEGIDGSGKSTQLQMLERQLTGLGYTVQCFREPGGTTLSEAVRDLLLDPLETMDPVTELLLFSAARSELITREVQPALKQGNIVLLDRFYDSTVAYQGFGRKCLAIEDISRINQTASHGIVPDLTFYFRISLQEASKRTDHLEKDRMEKSGMAFYKAVIEGFEYLAETEERIHIIDANRSREKQSGEILELVKLKLDRKGKKR